MAFSGCLTAGFGPWGPGMFGMAGFFGGRESKGNYIARKIKLIQYKHFYIQ